ncbi:MAG TPA: phenylalanine--tRNA ligase subunit beta, partial [Candidatus Saccharimonadales bacterium]|nr:phenylalanine--tRNA ligase subunit beta [Candidatus Saccharimonadales bacterium]
MKVSLNTIKYLNRTYHSAGDPTADGVDALIDRINKQLGAIEETIDLGKRYVGLRIVRVIRCEDHPNADKLHLCLVDDDKQVDGVERDSDGYVQIVCGAPNVREGMLAVWIPPGHVVPESVDSNEPFVIEKKEIRGRASNGMMASPRELALGDYHEGILEIKDEVEPGVLFADYYNLKDDLVIDIENKMFTHRPDCFGYLGVARELAGIKHEVYKSPEWYKPELGTLSPDGDELSLGFDNQLPELVPRFTALTVRDVKVGPSPLWLQIELAKVDIRPINNVVDLTNLYMVLTGQPIHAYDYDKVAALSENGKAALVVRHPREGEKITLLNGKTIEPWAGAMMVATNKQLICLGGAMGGGETEVSETTTNLIIEAATWDMYAMRRTAMTHGIFTDAVTRFTKGQSPLQNLAVVNKITEEITHYASGKVASRTIDDIHLLDGTLERHSLHEPIRIDAQFINERLGSSLAASEMATLLRNVEFDVTVANDWIQVTAPFWRTDIEIPEDLVEEVGRLYGYDNFPLVLPTRDLTPARRNQFFDLRSAIRRSLSKAGANEVLTYSFVHGNLLDKVGQDRKLAFQLSNALSPDLQYYRMSLMPSLLEKVAPNLRSGYSQFVLFEMGKGHTLLHKDDGEDNLPQEFELLGGVYAAADKVKTSGAAFYQARKYLTVLAKDIGLSLKFVPITEEMPHVPIMQPYESRRSVLVYIDDDSEQLLGVLGEFKTSVRQALKLPQHTAGFEINLKAAMAAQRQVNNYQVLSKFPPTEQDICFKVKTETEYGQLLKVVLEFFKPRDFIFHVTPVDIYQRQAEPSNKQITFRLVIQHYERTLKTVEINELL